MSKILNFIRECGTFFVLTINDDRPAGRPFGAIMEHDGDLFISTADMKAVYAQLKAQPRVQLLALKPGTRQWARVNGVADECGDIAIKQKMLDECPVLTKHFPTPTAPHYAVFRIHVESTELY